MIIMLSLLLDLLGGDPPNRLHPVAWMGSLISWLKEKSPPQSPFAQLACGALISLGGSVLFAAVGRLLDQVLEALPCPFQELGKAAVLKSTIGLRGLDQAAAQVESALESEDLPQARRSVRYHLVSRDTDQLHSGQVAAAAIQSVAENSSDGALAPMFFYQLGGLPAALAYRFVNTADAMLGYRDEEREWLGKIPARLDDLLNLAPARLSGILIVLASLTQRGNFRKALETMLRDARKTASPNAGYPMSAMAGALDVELEKVGHYRLNAGGRTPSVEDLKASRRLLSWAVVGGGLLLAVLSVLGLARQD